MYIERESWVGLGWVLLHINHSYLMPNRLYANILNTYDLVWFGLVLCHINHPSLVV